MYAYEACESKTNELEKRSMFQKRKWTSICDIFIRNKSRGEISGSWRCHIGRQRRQYKCKCPRHQ